MGSRVIIFDEPIHHTCLMYGLKETFNQIDRYQRDSFWAGCGLYEYVQIFVISNGTNTLSLRNKR